MNHIRSHLRLRTVHCALAAAALALAGHASASSIESTALAACTEAAAADGHATHLDVVRLVTHGRGNYEYWINADVTPARKSYCRTHAGEVSEFRGFGGRWISSTPSRPAPVAQAVSAISVGSAGAVCRSVDFTPPSNTGANPRND